MELHTHPAASKAAAPAEQEHNTLLLLLPAAAGAEGGSCNLVAPSCGRIARTVVVDDSRLVGFGAKEEGSEVEEERAKNRTSCWMGEREGWEVVCRSNSEMEEVEVVEERVEIG